ncbi:sulfite exporter TauE/SafE family protein [Rhizobium sp. ARZ01]|uniref:sulfite exporter TauE/SafE family protein n=1 Tax=Rhizobium sp. ARZ01 TaxID=2769313 RepID=UPI001780D032|nr:sulfite exporter TauE/SafE family protein [Rhizobium sp. ARZ01]MBD9372306.1 sulfite exporter TauE/SafE family protein [Rhizobium sp. ARZ01]
MDFWSSFNPLFSVSGFFVGMLVGVTGVGGGSLMTPLLVLLFGIHPVTAVGTDLLYAAITKTAGTAVHGRNKTIDWRIVGRLAAGSLPAATVTLWLVSGIDRNSITAVATITITLGYTLMLTALLLIFRRRVIEWIRHKMRNRRPVSPATVALLTMVLGLTIGVLVTLTSVGAGALGVTVLLALYPRLHVRDIVGSDIVHAVPLTLLAGMGYWAIGEVEWAMLAMLLVGSIPGIIIGSHLSPRLPERLISTLLAITLALVGTKLVFS